MSTRIQVFPIHPQGPCLFGHRFIWIPKRAPSSKKWPGHTMEPMPSFHPMITVMVSSSCVTFFWCGENSAGCNGGVLVVAWKRPLKVDALIRKLPVNSSKMMTIFFWSQRWPFCTGKFGSAECWSTWAYHVETYYVSGSITTTLLCIKMYQ